MNAETLIADLRRTDIHLSARGGILVVDAPKEALTTDVLATLRANKAELLAALTVNAVTRTWQLDGRGRLWFEDGTVYAPLINGDGWILVKHPTRRMHVPGTLEVFP